MAPDDEEIGQRSGHEQAMTVVVETAVVDLCKTERPLYHADGMHDLGLHLAFGVAPACSASSMTPSGWRRRGAARRAPPGRARAGTPARYARTPLMSVELLSVAQQSAELDHEHFQHVMASGIARARIPQTLEARLEALHRCPLGDQPQWVESIRPAPGKHKSHLSRLFQRRFPSAQHSLQPRPWATIAGLGADWLDQTSQLAPRHHALHLRQKGGRAVSSSRAA